jgi:AcrR family transcriptional regulator
LPRGIGLDRDKVIEAACALADEEGPEALTLSHLADKLGVRAPSLFKHVASLQDLRSAVAARVYQELERETEASGSDLLAMALAWRRWARAHPGMYALAARTHLAGSAEQQQAGKVTLDRVLTAVREASPGDPVHGARAIRAMVHGFVLLEQAQGFGLDTPVEESFLHAMQALIRGLQAPPQR